MTIRDVAKLMDNYCTIGGYNSVEDKGYVNYLAKQVGITKQNAKVVIEDYLYLKKLIGLKSEILATENEI